MKNRRGEIATLLTLGLVLVGGLVTLATSFIISRQSNLSSTPRAAGCGSGAAYPCDPAEGYNPSVCGTTGLEYACCVQDKFYCGGEDRFRWFGCLGQPCRNTKISQSNGPGYLVACPAGVDQGNVESCAADLPPTEAPIEEPTEGTEGGPCKSTYVGGSTIYEYTCDQELVCSEQTSKGVCEKDTSEGEDTTNVCLDKNDPSLNINYICISNSNSCPNQSPKGSYNDSSLSCGNSSQKCCYASKSDLTDTPPPPQDEDGDQEDEDSEESTPIPIDTPIPTPTSIQTLNTCQNNIPCGNNPNIRYSQKCDATGNNGQCISRTYFANASDCQNNKNSFTGINEWCDDQKTSVQINYTINATGDIQLAQDNDCWPPYPYLRIMVFRDRTTKQLAEETITSKPTNFPIKGAVTVNTETGGTFFIRVSYLTSGKKFGVCWATYRSLTSKTQSRTSEKTLNFAVDLVNTN